MPESVFIFRVSYDDEPMFDSVYPLGTKLPENHRTRLFQVEKVPIWDYGVVNAHHRFVNAEKVLEKLTCLLGFHRAGNGMVSRNSEGGLVRSQ